MTKDQSSQRYYCYIDTHGYYCRYQGTFVKMNHATMFDIKNLFDEER